MGCVNECVPFRLDLCFGQPGAGAFEGLFLNVESEDVSALAHRLAEKEGVVTVAHGEIGGDVPLAEVGKNKVFLKIEKIDHCYASRSLI